MAYLYQTVWKQITPELISELTEFWTRENTLPKGAQPARRAEQVVIVMRDDTDRSIVAVSSVIARVVPRLRQVLYYYRTFCAEKHRRNNTSIPIMQATQKALRDYNLGLPKPEAIGSIVEIESAYINQRYPEAFWEQTKFGFIGYSPRAFRCAFTTSPISSFSHPFASHVRRTPRARRRHGNADGAAESGP